MKIKNFHFGVSVILLSLLFFIGNVSAVSVCVDNENPSAPDGLAVSGSVGNILIAWGESVDSPVCSGIFEYVVSRDGVELGRVNEMVDGRWSMVDGAVLGSGEYAYTVYAVDLVGRNAGRSVKNVISVGGGGGSSGGSRSSGFICEVNWSCSEWSECLGGGTRRICVDLNKCGTPYLKPNEYLSCEEDEGEVALEILDNAEPSVVDKENGFFSAITGAVVGGGMVSWIGAGVFVLLIGAGFVFVARRRG